MRPRPELPPGPYLVVGLARSGAAIARALAERGEEVIGVDAARPAEAAGLEGAGVEVNLDADGSEQEHLLTRAGTLVKSPGVPRQAPVVAAALERGMPAIGELEAAWRLTPNPFVAVTGTNGKTTVAELLGHVWRTAGEPVAVAGNVGTPLAALASPGPPATPASPARRLEPDATVVCECSSFQLEDADAFAPECAVFLNFAPDHLDRHASLDEYLEAKLRVFANQSSDDVAVYNAGEPALEGRDLGGAGRKVAFSPGDLPVDPSELRIAGRHNLENAAAAAAAALAMGLPREAVAEGLRSFAGVPHRLERVAELGGVLYVNDSKATNAAAAAAALRAFPGRPLRAILGGSLKGGGFEGLVEPLRENAKAAYLVGEAAGRLAEDLRPAAEAGVELRRAEGLEDAVAAAAADAAPGDVVLLAPACASFDAFRDFEQRGERFRELVEALG